MHCQPGRTHTFHFIVNALKDALARATVFKIMKRKLCYDMKNNLPSRSQCGKRILIELRLLKTLSPLYMHTKEHENVLSVVCAEKNW